MNISLDIIAYNLFVFSFQVHFEESQFELHRQDGWRKLKPNAVPTLFPEPVESPNKRKEKATPQKRKRSSSSEEEDSDVEVEVPPLKIVRLKKRLTLQDSSAGKKKSPVKKNSPRATGECSKSSQKENVSPRRRKGRPRKVVAPKPVTIPPVN